jgi:DHA1 family bicyclomycin/chloramphenicol resistance-like MFS transporter
VRLIGHASRPPGKALIVFIAGLFSLLAVASDLYLPALPALRRDLGASDAQAQLTLSALVVGFGVAQLAYGPFSDRFGRRPVLLAGLAVFILASIAAMLAPTIETLVGARFLQGVGACSGQVIGRAIVRDVYEPVRGARTLAQIFLVLGLAPLFGPLLGGYLAVWFGWRATFAFLVLCGIAVWAASWRLLAETNRNLDPSATDLATLAANARRIVTNATFVGYAACYTFTYCGLFAFLSAAPFVLIEVLGVPPERFGLWFMIGVAGNLSGAYFCSRLTQRFALPRLLAIGACASASGGLTMLGLALAGVAHPLAIIGPMALYLFGHAFTSPVCMAVAVGPFPKNAGLASALLGFIQLGIGAVSGQVLMRLHDGTTRPLAIAVALFACSLLAAYLALVRGRR